jgi:hypothetical protein
MTLNLELWAIFGVLCYNAYCLNEIRKISNACYVELNTTRWENGRSVRIAKDQVESLSPVRRQA